MKTFLDKLTDLEILNLGLEFRKSEPFNHLIIDNFLNDEDARSIANEFPSFDDDFWYSYDNPLEIKKASNDWNKFGPNTYKYFTHILSKEFTEKLNLLISDNSIIKLIPDIGLHGGGYHTHKNGGRLNPHLDYSIHPKLLMQRKVNIILYVNPHWKTEFGGDLGFWSDLNGQPDKLVKETGCVFNRAVIFDTSQNSWHGISKEINAFNELTRNSLATYYLVQPPENTDQRMKVKYAPRDDQKGNMEIQDLINKRQSINEFNLVYKTNKH
jgi:hypothetical protein